MKVELEIEDKLIPDGYAAVAFRIPVYGDEIITSEGGYLKVFNGFQTPRLILRKLPPPEPVWRAWKDRSEVPGELKYVRVLGAVEDSAHWIVPTKLLLHGIETNGSTDSWQTMLQRREWSPDGKQWFTCGVLESGQ